MLTNNHITGNTSTGWHYQYGSDFGGGGGAYISATTATLTNNSFSGNTGGASGGGASISGASATLTNNSFSGNTGGASGGGVSISGASATLTNNSFSGNTGSTSGGGVSISGSTATLTNNTLVDNEGGDGGGLILSTGSTETTDSASLYNNLLWANRATGADSAADLRINNDDDGDYLPTPVTLLANNFDWSAGGFKITLPITIHSSNLNAQDLLFVNQAAGNLRLTAGSPMIDAGYPNTPNLPATDLGGGPRVLGAAVDIGAYEFDDGSGIPDFVVTSLVLTPTSPFATTTFSAQITLKNQGHPRR
ncbi:MAG: hypothetical protein IPN92_09865 [Chromatiaceae bacterium]|nr:hypothetical protein [Chromatiaceae bacterium]